MSLPPDPFGVALWALHDAEREARRTRPAPSSTGGPSVDEDGAVVITDPERYAASALQRAVDEMRLLGHGERNHGLNAAAFSLGKLVGGGLLDYDDVVGHLDQASAELWPDRDPHNCMGTIHSGLRGGLRDPLAWVQGERTAVEPATPFLAGDTRPFMRDLSAEPATDGVERTTWWPRKIDGILSGDEADDEPPPAYLFRADGKALFYAGKVNGLIGESESGKTWVALLAVAQTLKAGHAVLYLDFEDTAAGIVGRLRALGVPPGLIASGLVYVGPDETLSPAAERDLAEVLHSHRPALVIVDGYNAAMTLLGLNLQDNTDVTAFSLRVLRPIKRTGACVVTIDHVTKSKDGRGAYAIGAQAKRADIDGCLIAVEVGQAFGRGSVGRLKLTVSKDRPGHVRAVSGGARNAGEAVLRSSPEAGDIVAVINGPDLRPIEERPAFRPTVLMQRVSEFLEALAEPVVRTAVKNGVKGNNEHVLDALDLLVKERYARLDGTRYLSTRPYREVQDPAAEGGSSLGPPPAPAFVVAPETSDRPNRPTPSPGRPSASLGTVAEIVPPSPPSLGGGTRTVDGATDEDGFPPEVAA